MLLGGSVCEERGCDRSVGVDGRGWVCWMGGGCELIFVFTEAIEASGEGRRALCWIVWVRVSEV